MMNNTFSICYGKETINYSLLLSKRASLEIAVHPDKTVIVKAPEKSELQQVQQHIKKRARWIKRQINYFEQFTPRTPQRIYTGGESHLYLGRKYRLKIQTTKADNISLTNGYFCIDTKLKEPEHIRYILEKWYKEKAEKQFHLIFQKCWESFGYKNLEVPNIKIRKMNKRWGSLSKKGNLSLNLDLIKAPKECIEYVIVHELRHLIQHNHNPEFYRLLEAAMPDWAKRKHKLEIALL